MGHTINYKRQLRDVHWPCCHRGTVSHYDDHHFSLFHESWEFDFDVSMRKTIGEYRTAGI